MRVWSSLLSYWVRARPPYRCLVVGAVLSVLAPACSLLGALALSRALRSSVGGWGDLIGAVLGIYAGFWVAASAVFVLAVRLGSRSWWVGVFGVAGLLPVTALTVALLANLGTPFPATVTLLWVLVSVCATWAGSPHRHDRTTDDLA